MNQEALHIMLADDDEAYRLFFKEAIAELKLNTIVNTVNDDVELMDYFNLPDVWLPHLLFLDLDVPKKGGLECLKEIRILPKLKDISVAVYSGSVPEEVIESILITGANIYLKKPDSFTKLKKLLKEVIVINWQYLTLGLNKENFLLSI
jgi:CheY-like chemotaxis protein